MTNLTKFSIVPQDCGTTNTPRQLCSPYATSRTWQNLSQDEMSVHQWQQKAREREVEGVEGRVRDVDASQTLGMFFPPHYLFTLLNIYLPLSRRNARRKASGHYHEHHTATPGHHVTTKASLSGHGKTSMAQWTDTGL
jgi:hypothetical protein